MREFDEVWMQGPWFRPKAATLHSFCGSLHGIMLSSTATHHNKLLAALHLLDKHVFCHAYSPSEGHVPLPMAAWTGRYKHIIRSAQTNTHVIDRKSTRLNSSHMSISY